MTVKEQNTLASKLVRNLHKRYSFANMRKSGSILAICHTYFDDGYRKYEPALPHCAIYKKLKPFRTGIERTFGLV